MSLFHGKNGRDGRFLSASRQFLSTGFKGIGLILVICKAFEVKYEFIKSLNTYHYFRHFRHFRQLLQLNKNILYSGLTILSVITFVFWTFAHKNSGT